MARIHISNDPSGRIIVSFPYDPLLVAKVNTIDGRRWHPALKGTVPDLRTEQSVVVESGLSPKFDFKDLRKDLVSRKCSYKTIKGYF